MPLDGSPVAVASIAGRDRPSMDIAGGEGGCDDCSQGNEGFASCWQGAIHRRGRGSP